MRDAVAYDVDTAELAESLHRIARGIENDEIHVVRVTTAETASVEGDPSVVHTFMLRYLGPPESFEKIRYMESISA